MPWDHRKKYEIATDEPGNPIKQDEKKGKLREVSRFHYQECRLVVT